MDYEIFISENIQEVTKDLSDTIKNFKSKRIKISFDYLAKKLKQIDLLEFTNQRQFFIQSFIFERLVKDLDEINESIENNINTIEEDFLKRKLFESSILESILDKSHKKSDEHKEYLLYIRINQDYLDTQLEKYLSNLMTNIILIDDLYLDKLKNWCFESFQTPKFYTRKYIYLHLLNNKVAINKLINPSNYKKNILDFNKLKFAV